MIRFAAVVLLALVTFTVVAQQPDEAAPAKVDLEHTKWIDGALRSMQAVKVGMTRSALLKVFTSEGGISTASQRTYVYRACPYIKVDVKFDAPHLLEELPTDKIIEISRPYLEWSIMD